MATELKQLFQEALELTDNDGATLAGLLIESPEDAEDPDVQSAWAAETITTLERDRVRLSQDRSLGGSQSTSFVTR